MSEVLGYKLRRPCANCPFRTDVPGYLRRGRAQGIAEALANGAQFACHETTVDGIEETDDGEEIETLVAGEGSQFCAGALLVMEAMEQPNQIVRIAERMGKYDPSKMDTSAPVHRSLHAFVLHHGDDGVGVADEESECCSVADMGCLAPAGVLVGDVALPAEPEGEVSECPCCGEPVCENCSDESGNCNGCVESGYVVA